MIVSCAFVTHNSTLKCSLLLLLLFCLFVCKLVWILWMLASIYHAKNLPYFISKTHKAHTPTQRNNGIGVVIKTHSQNLFNFHIPNRVMSWNLSFSSTHHSYWFYQQDSILHLHIYNSISCSFIIVCLTHFLVVLSVFMNYSHSKQYILCLCATLIDFWVKFSMLRRDSIVYYLKLSDKFVNFYI